MHFILSPGGKKFIFTLCLMATFSWKTSNGTADKIPGTTAGGNINETSDTDTIQVSNALNNKKETGAIDYATDNGIDKSRLGFTIAGSVTGWAAMTIYLYESLYKNNLHSSFRFINDLGENKDIDKTGHLFSSYTLSIAGIHLMKQTGMDRKRAAWIGGSYGTLFLSTKEILDGFRVGYGFSVPDMAANIAGSALAVSQELLLGHQVIRVKYSYHESGLAKDISDDQEKTLARRMIFNYNGQTHWLSLNINSLGGRMEVFPGWLNIAFGYSVCGVTGGCSGPSIAKSTGLTNSAGYRQVFIAPDIDLSAIETGSDFFNGVLRTLNFIKIPSPAIEYNRVNGFRLHLLFF
jgi:uncharacterized protein YfiM (DUF2279 family)